jgi:hypothetical protein
MGDEHGNLTQLVKSEFLVVQHGVDLDLPAGQPGPGR